MLELTKKQTTGKFVEFCLKVPAEDASQVMNATREFLKLAGHEVRELNEDGEELFSVEEVFPDSHPGKRLRGLRTREDLTQKALAEKVGLKPHHVSEMESGKRPIGKKVAARIGKVFDIDPRHFL